MGKCETASGRPVGQVLGLFCVRRMGLTCATGCTRSVSCWSSHVGMVYVSFCCRSCTARITLPTLVHVKRLLLCSNVFGGHVWHVMLPPSCVGVLFVSAPKTSMQALQASCSPCPSPPGQACTGLWILLLICPWSTHVARSLMPCLFASTSSASSPGWCHASWGKESWRHQLLHNCFLTL